MYVSWVLIITLVFQTSSHGGASATSSVHSITDFHSQKECLAAGRTWAADFVAQRSRVDGTYVCVQRTIDLPAPDQM